MIRFFPTHHCPCGKKCPRLQECPLFLAMSAPMRRGFQLGAKLCAICLDYGHTTEECKTLQHCCHCLPAHHHLLHGYFYLSRNSLHGSQVRNHAMFITNRWQSYLKTLRPAGIRDDLHKPHIVVPFVGLPTLKAGQLLNDLHLLLSI